MKPVRDPAMTGTEFGELRTTPTVLSTAAAVIEVEACSLEEVKFARYGKEGCGVGTVTKEKEDVGEDPD